MNKTVRFLYLFLSSVVILSSCRNDNDPLEPGHRRQPSTNHVTAYTVKMNFGGDYIKEMEEPLGRAADGDTYVGLNVMRKEKGTDVSEPYAYGVFKGNDNLEITLVSGYTYDFEASILTEKTDRLSIRDNMLYEPFRRSAFSSSSQNFGFSKNNLQKFIYSFDSASPQFLYQLNSGVAEVEMADSQVASFGKCSNPRVKRFYGTLSDFDPVVSQTVDIVMSYRCFGIKILVEKMPEGTSLSVEDSNLSSAGSGSVYEFVNFPKSLSLSSADGSNDWEDIYSLSNLISEAGDNFRLRFIWHKSASETEEFFSDINVNAKIRKVLKINITGASRTDIAGNIRLTQESETLVDEVQNVDFVTGQN